LSPSRRFCNASGSPTPFSLNWHAIKGINLTLDVQGVNNPAYNHDRGPVPIMALRVHAEF